MNVSPALTGALDTFNTTCSAGNQLFGISLYGLSPCPAGPTLIQVAAAVAAQHQSYVSTGGPTTLTALQGSPLFASCGAAAAKQFLSAIDAQLQDTNPQVWYGAVQVPPTCPGCTQFHVLVMLYYPKVKTVVVLDGQYSWA